MANSSCPALNALPNLNDYPISSKVDYVYIHGQNVSDAAMTDCCAPNSVNLVDGCYEWCELPARYTNTSMARHNAMADFNTCLQRNGKKVLILGANIRSSAPIPRVSLRAVAVVALIASLFL